VTREERHALLRKHGGDEILAHIHACVDAAPAPGPEAVAHLRRIMTRPAGEVPQRTPAADAA
jgi:hypothetical protein